MKWNKILLINFLLVGFSSFAQEILSVDKAVKIALSNNYGIHIAKNNLQKAENNNHIYNKGLLPNLSANSSTSRNNASSKSTNSQGIESENSNAITKSYSAGVQLSYTLFDGFQRWYSNLNLKESLALSKLDARQIIENTLLQVYSTYYTASLLSENVNNQLKILEVSKNRFERALIKENYGQVTQLDVLNAEVDINNDSIRLLELENQLLNVKRDLNVLLGRPVAIEFTTESQVNFKQDLKKSKLLEYALNENVTLLRGQKQLAIGENIKSLNKGYWLPKLNFNSSYNWSLQDSNNEQLFILKQRTTGFNTGLSLSWNIFDGGRSIIQNQNSAIDILNAETTLEQIKQELTRDVHNAWASYQNALYLLEVQAKNVETNQNNFKRTEEKFKLGQINSITFRQAQVNLLNAHTNYNKAVFDAKISELQLLQLSGKMDLVSL